MTEQWRSIPDAPGYEASDHGHIKSVKRTVVRSNGRPYYVRERLLRLTVARTGHLRVGLHIGELMVVRLVHQLVLEAFVGPRPQGLVSRHLDDDPTNNGLNNLRWGTQQENLRDRVRNGRDPHASRTDCPHGHAFDSSNTRFNKDGHRACLTCQRAASRRYRARRAAA